MYQPKIQKNKKNIFKNIVNREVLRNKDNF